MTFDESQNTNDEQKKLSWESVQVFLDGRLIQVKEVNFTRHVSLNELQNELQRALDVEDYLKCDEIQKKIDNYKIEL